MPLIKLFIEWGTLNVVMVLPRFPGATPNWLSLLRPFVMESEVLCAPGALGAVVIPSSSGFAGNLLPLPYGLTAFRCLFPPAPPPPAVLPVALKRVLVFSDSMLCSLENLSWPAPLRVVVRCFSGAGLKSVVNHCLRFLPSAFDMALIHAGVNDASRGGDDFEDVFGSSCAYARVALKKRFPESRVAFSLACVTASAPVNARVVVVNRMLRETAASRGFGLLSNDNIRFADLNDTVHLNAAGTARLYNNILNFLRDDAA